MDHYLVEEQKCNIHMRDNVGNTPLFQAVVAGKLETMKYFINERGCDPMARGMHGTPLHYACGLGRLDMVKYLVEEVKVDTMCRDGNASLPLHLAAQYGTLDVVKYWLRSSSATSTMQTWLETHLSIKRRLETS